MLTCFVEIPVFNANSADPDQMPHSVASDLGLHCLPSTLLGVSRLKLVNLRSAGELFPFYCIQSQLYIRVSRQYFFSFLHQDFHCGYYFEA